MGEDVIRPFRWDISRRNELGSLPDVEPPETYREFEDDLVTCAARVIGFAGDSDLVFVGRSPQPLFDLLSGLLFDSRWRDRLRLLNVSLRLAGSPTEQQANAFYRYMREVGLEPRAVVRGKRSFALVDVVATGDTFGALLTMLERRSASEGEDWRAVAAKLRIVGLSYRTKTSPNTRRWHQHAEWVDRLRPREVKNVSTPGRLFHYLADEGPKTSVAFVPKAWGDEALATPRRDEVARQALALAVRLFDLGRTKDVRSRFVRAAVEQPAMSEDWFRSLVLELRR